MNDNGRAAKIFALFQQLAELLIEQESPNVPAPRPAPERALLTVEEAAERLHIGRTRMFDLVKSGQIESVQIGRLRRIHPDAIEAYTRRLHNNFENGSDES
jgi:excisionase family DNA binding protein